MASAAGSQSVLRHGTVQVVRRKVPLPRKVIVTVQRTSTLSGQINLWNA